MGDMGGLRAIVNAGEKVRTGQFLIFLYIDLVHTDANHPLALVIITRFSNSLPPHVTKLCGQGL